MRFSLRANFFSFNISPKSFKCIFPFVIFAFHQFDSKYLNTCIGTRLLLTYIWISIRTENMLIFIQFTTFTLILLIEKRLKMNIFNELLFNYFFVGSFSKSCTYCWFSIFLRQSWSFDIFVERFFKKWFAANFYSKKIKVSNLKVIFFADWIWIN